MESCGESDILENLFEGEHEWYKDTDEEDETLTYRRKNERSYPDKPLQEQTLTDSENEGYECDKDTDDECEIFTDRRKVKRRRGRPYGSRKRKSPSEDDNEAQRVKRQKTEQYPVGVLAAVFCCAGMCLSRIPQETILLLREHIASLTVSETSQWVLDWLWTHPRYMLGLLCLLVEKRIFRKVKISFLMVGHTHEDIDQVFSRFSVCLQKKPATTLPKLMAAWEKCLASAPKAFQTDNVVNITEWLQAHINPVTGHSQPHAFRITLGEDGKAKLVFKKWANDKDWLESSGSEKYLIGDLPTTNPQYLTPSLQRIDIERLKVDVRRIIKLYAPDDLFWWNSFFERTDSVNDKDDRKSTVIDDLVAAKMSQRSASNNAENPIQLNSLHEEDDKPVNITIGKPRKKESKELETGMLCLLDVPEYAGEWPQLAKVVSVEGARTLVQWYKGSKTTSWQPCTRRSGSGGKWVPWTEYVPTEFIWCRNIELTPSGKLQQKIKEKIEDYNEL